MRTSAAQLSALQLLLGSRWFELPASLLNTYLPAKARSEAPTARQHALEQKAIDALTALIDTTKYSALPGGGYSQTGTLQSVANALAPVVVRITTNPVKATGKIPGTYQLGITLSDSTATGAHVAITAPNGRLGDVTVRLSATVFHQSLDVTAPAGATVITPQLIASLSGHVGSTGLSLG